MKKKCFSVVGKKKMKKHGVHPFDYSNYSLPSACTFISVIGAI
jgi:hypothetical protein